MCEQPRCTRIELVHQDRTCQRIRSLRWIGCGGGEASQVYMCDTPLTHWRGGGFMRHVSSSFIEFIKTLVGLHRTVPSPYSQPILTPGWHFNASQNEGSQYASEVVKIHRHCRLGLRIVPACEGGRIGQGGRASISCISFACCADWLSDHYREPNLVSQTS